MDAIIIAFASGKGGTGKSTAAVMIGGALAALGKKVLLIELDCALRSVDVIAGVSGQTVFDIEDVLSGRAEADKAIVESPVYKGLSIISAPYAGGVITSGGLRAVCTRLRPKFDYILLDTAAGLGAAFSAAAETAHRMFLVLTPDPVTLRDGRLITDNLPEQISQLRLILNRVSNRALQDGAIADLDEAIDTVGVQLLGVIPDSPLIRKAGANGEPLPAHSREHAVFAAIAQRILGEDVPLVVH